MPDQSRETLIIPTPDELRLAVESMHQEIIRAHHRGVEVSGYAELRHRNASRIFEDATHLEKHVVETSEKVWQAATSKAEAYLFGARDMLELLSRATTIARLPRVEDEPH